MKNIWKKAAAAVLAGTMAFSMLTGCGKKEVSPDKYASTVVLTVGEEKIYLDEANYLLRGEQYGFESMYGSIGYTNAMLWTQELDDGSTMEEYVRTAVMTEMVQMYRLIAHAEELGVSLSDEDKEKVQKRLDQDEKLDDTFKKLSGYTRELAENLYMKNALAIRVYEKLVEDVDTSVKDDEFIHVKADYLFLKNPTVEAATGASGETTTAAATTTAAETTKDTGVATEAEADEILAKLQEEKDVVKVYDALKDQYENRLVKYEDRSIGEDQLEVSQLYKAIYEMKTGETKKFYLEGKGWYLIYCETDNDPVGRQEAIDAEIESRKGKLFVEKYAELIKDGPDYHVEYEIWNSLKLAGQPAYEVPETTAAPSKEASSTEAETTTAAGEGTTAEGTTAEGTTADETTEAATK